jgi:hypothetical protein
MVDVSPGLMLVFDGALTLNFLPPSPSVVFFSPPQPGPHNNKATVSRPVIMNEIHFIEESSGTQERAIGLILLHWQGTQQ